METNNYGKDCTEQEAKQAQSNNENIMFVVISFIVFLAVLFYVLSNLLDNKKTGNISNSINSNGLNSAGLQNSNLMQVNGDQSTGVEATVVYEKDKSQNQLFFKLYFNTHSVDYSNYNFQDNIAVKDLSGKEYKALNVVKQGSGHHQSIEISFPIIPSPFKVVIKNLAGVPEREFNW